MCAAVPRTLNLFILQKSTFKSTHEQNSPFPLPTKPWQPLFGFCFWEFGNFRPLV